MVGQLNLFIYAQGRSTHHLDEWLPLVKEILLIDLSNN